MLTRIEIDGFKSFEKFGMDVGPLTVILGPNASGKSNLFDAIRLLSRLADTDLRTAVTDLRGEPHELFRRHPDGALGETMSFAVEVLLAPEVRDQWGATVKLKHTRVRYEVHIERRRDTRGIERLVTTREEAAPILASADRWRPSGRRPSPEFKRTFMRYSRRTPWLSTVDSQGSTRFEIRQDLRAGRQRPADAAEATVLSSITSAEFPHLYALREELRSWRFLQLDPTALRQPSPAIGPEELAADGKNLARVLARIEAETRTERRSSGALADITADLTDLIPGVVGLRVVEDQRSQEYRVDLSMRDRQPFSSRVVSDGTLRVLALLTLMHDPRHRGLVCFEEPENGVHPFRLKSLIARLRDLVTDPASAEVDRDDPLAQLLVNSHSPVLLAALEDYEMNFSDVKSSIDPSTKSVSRKTSILPIKKPKTQWEKLLLLDTTGQQYVTPAEVDKYLATVDREG